MTALLVATVVILALVGGVWWLRTHIVVVRVEGISMEPTLRGDDRVVVRRLPVSKLRVGQIVVVERPYRDGNWGWRPVTTGIGHRKWIIKRLAALPGDPIPAVVAAAGATTVPPGHAVVLGDNVGASIDSRVFGLVPLDRVLGVALRRYAHDDPFIDGMRGEDARSAANSRTNRGIW